jgi:hypothetical protein
MANSRAINHKAPTLIPNPVHLRMQADYCSAAAVVLLQHHNVVSRCVVSHDQTADVNIIVDRTIKRLAACCRDAYTVQCCYPGKGLLSEQQRQLQL